MIFRPVPPSGSRPLVSSRCCAWGLAAASVPMVSCALWGVLFMAAWEWWIGDNDHVFWSVLPGSCLTLSIGNAWLLGRWLAADHGGRRARMMAVLLALAYAGTSSLLAIELW